MTAVLAPTQVNRFNRLNRLRLILMVIVVAVALSLGAFAIGRQNSSSVPARPATVEVTPPVKANHASSNPVEQDRCRQTVIAHIC